MGMKLLDKWIHGVLAIVELLSKNKNLGCMLARNDDNSILIGNDDVVRVDLDAIAINRERLTPPKR